MSQTRSFTITLPLLFLAGLLAALWVAGGASRADALGQAVVRAVAAGSLVLAILLAPRPSFGPVRPVLYILAAAILIPCLQLVPLPPDLWQELPGRSLFLEAAAASAQSQPWRPLSIVPDGTLNAAASLLIPAAALVLIAQLQPREFEKLPGLLLVLILASACVGLVQLTGTRFDHPLINDKAGQISGTFANRNHFALWLAMGCLIAPVWAFFGKRKPGWRAPAAFGAILLFVLTILATGSRAGMLGGSVAVALGLLLVRHDIRRLLRRAPPWAFPALLGGVLSILAIVVLLSIVTDRATSIDRLFLLDEGGDMRSRALPTVLSMIETYFPTGSGFGGFDPIFRIHEPAHLLKLSYFNHAHNDFLEVALEGGAAALALLAMALGWWVFATVRVWRGGAGMVLGRLGSGLLLLVLIASAFDYPARTPMIMAVIVIAAAWLSRDASASSRPALPEREQHL